MTSLPEYLAGIAVVLTVLSDIFRTVLLPRPTHRALRLAPILGRSFAPLWRRAAGTLRSPTARQTVRASLGPFLLVLSILLWVSALVIGYALMLHARAGDMEPSPGPWDALYHAGSAFMTIGFTDVSIHGPSRVTVVLAGMTGLAGVTILATFILSVQSALQVREVPVIQLAAATAGPPSGLALLVGIGRSGSHDRLAEVFRTWSTWAATVLHDHRANPVLMNFRSADEQCEWLAAFAAVLDAASLVMAAMDGEKLKPGVALAEDFILVGAHTVTNLASIFRLEAGPGDADAVTRAPPVAGGAALREALAGAGYPVRDTVDLARLNDLRRRYMPDLLALADAFDIAVKVTLDHDPVPARV